MEEIVCDKKMSFEDCELALLRHAVEETEEINEKKLLTHEVMEIISILKIFMVKKKVICYGGTAINNILPKKVQFYSEDQIPDFDFFSKTPLNDTKELADIYYKKGFKSVEAKSGVHYGTFKVFVNYIPIADITYLEKGVFDSIIKECIIIDGIQYAPPNYLRRSMFSELSRPNGDVSRWEKVFTRLKLLNEYYPLKIKEDCLKGKKDSLKINQETFNLVLETLIHWDVVFFGGYAFNLYSEYSKNKKIKQLSSDFPHFDVISEDYEEIAQNLLEMLKQNKIKGQIKKNQEFGDIIPENIEILIGGKTIVCIYKAVTCYSYNELLLTAGNNIIKIASIDTILSFYLAFIYANNKMYDKERILCMAGILFEIEQEYRTEKTGLLKRFSVECYGKQKTLTDIRVEKAEKYNELISKKGSKEYEFWFLKYKPDDIYSKKHLNGMLPPNKKRNTRKEYNKGKFFIKSPRVNKSFKKYFTKKNKKRKNDYLINRTEFNFF